MSVLFIGLMIVFIVLCLFLMLVILIQRGRGGGLSAAFGGAGGNTAFGAKTGDVLTWVTAATFGVFLVLAISLNLLASQMSADERTRLSGVTVTGNSTSNQPSPVQSSPVAPTTSPVSQPESAPTTKP
ncbi:MAG: preprotein translocase subunit SecG [Tepidisphaeraceae bacterium]